MALQTLKGKQEVGGYPVLDLNTLFDAMGNPTQEAIDKYNLADENGKFSWDRYDELRKKAPISITHTINTISFRIQDGPIREVGINGCQVDTLIHVAKEILEGFQKHHPNIYNDLAIRSLDDALRYLEERTKDRIIRGVEGTSNA